jgi:carbamoyl-phosphate synthase large subunit
MNILITSAGRRVSLVKAFKKELKAYFPNAKVFATDSSPQLSSACMVADDWFKVPKLNSTNYINELISKCKNNSISIIIPTIDTELILLAENKEIFDSKGIKVILSSLEFVKICRDKRTIHEFFKSKGIIHAKEYKKNNFVLPVFIKPNDGSGSADTFLIESDEDITEDHFQNDRYMFLEYIDLQIFTEYTCDLYYGKDSKLKCVIPRKRIKVRDGEVNKSKTEKNELVLHIKEHLSHIEGARGCLTAQFFFNDVTKKIIGIEINPRFGGGYPLTYLAGGNFLKWIIEEYILHKEINYFEDWEENLLMLRYDDEVIVRNYNE